jgi:hypothetical protein
MLQIFNRIWCLIVGHNFYTYCWGCDLVCTRCYLHRPPQHMNT